MSILFIQSIIIMYYQFLLRILGSGISLPGLESSSQAITHWIELVKDGSSKLKLFDF